MASKDNDFALAKVSRTPRRRRVASPASPKLNSILGRRQTYYTYAPLRAANATLYGALKCRAIGNPTLREEGSSKPGNVLPGAVSEIILFICPYLFGSCATPDGVVRRRGGERDATAYWEILPSDPRPYK
ncbi:hypothetical protein EVAR_16373_1 [Eumeta japonica]|uniref:Uncharacterized protein n=1 Tax=Eumeta variegata TaxID=151549 RepID=A0A4C1VWR1_EUMVA|nr:hypothetical protein EVAR_16373_1 [Eumeta japonica]